MIRQIEQISMNAWPALQTILYDGWILRFAGGVTRRANSINPIFESNIQVDKKIRFCEDLYSSRDLSVIYKLTSDISPSDLDTILIDLGYEKEADTSVQLMTINGPDRLDKNFITLSEKLDSNWLNRFIKFNNYDQAKTIGFQNILEQIAFKKCYIDLIVNGQYIGCGLGVLENTHIGIFDVVVNPQFRKKGYGKTIVESIVHWGYENGATIAYLQVMLNNSPALRLYEKIGFKEVYKYWYRVKPIEKAISQQT
jgi:GNAT superfamily N-acetyltransferase